MISKDPVNATMPGSRMTALPPVTERYQVTRRVMQSQACGRGRIRMRDAIDPAGKDRGAQPCPALAVPPSLSSRDEGTGLWVRGRSRRPGLAFPEHGFVTSIAGSRLMVRSAA